MENAIVQTNFAILGIDVFMVCLLSKLQYNVSYTSIPYKIKDKRAPTPAKNRQFFVNEKLFLLGKES